MDSWGVPPGMSGGLKWRVGLSILLGIGWLSFVLIWLLFFADGFSIYRNLAILFLSLLLTGAVLTATWLSYGMRMAEYSSPECTEWMGLRSMRLCMIATLLLWGAWAGLVIGWLYLVADAMSGYQNIAVLLISFLLAAGVSTAIWMYATQ